MNGNILKVNKMFWNFDNITFDMCGLNKEKNFLQAQSVNVDVVDIWISAHTMMRLLMFVNNW